MVIKHPSLPLKSGVETSLSPAAEQIAAPAATTPTTAAKPAKEPPGELIAMGRIARLVDSLADPVRGRVVRWAFEKYCGDAAGE